jgi:hypothetical protein
MTRSVVSDEFKHYLLASNLLYCYLRSSTATRFLILNTHIFTGFMSFLTFAMDGLPSLWCMGVLLLLIKLFLNSNSESLENIKHLSCKKLEEVKIITCCLMTTYFLGAKNICIPQLIESQKQNDSLDTAQLTLS